MSSSESRQRLTTRRKRRRSVSYRNRATNRSRSCILPPSNSSSDSVHVETSPKVRRTRKRWTDPKTEKLKSGKASCTNIEEMVSTVNRVVSSEHQAVSTSSSRLGSREAISSRVNRYERASNASRDLKRVRIKRLYGSLKSKQK